MKQADSSLNEVLTPDELVKQLIVQRVESLREDPRSKEVTAYIHQHWNEVLAAFLADGPRLEKVVNLHVEHPDAVVGSAFEKDGLVFDFNFYFNFSPPQVFVEVFDKVWAEEGKALKQKIFPSELAYEFSNCQGDFYPTAFVASQLGTKGEMVFEAQKEFDPSGIVDSIGRGLDRNAIEAIRLFNMLGLETNSSCGGHPEREHYPYFRFNRSSLEKVVQLFSAYQKESGVEWYFSPLGSRLDSFHVYPPLTLSVPEAQHELDRFTDFLSGKLKLQLLRLSVPEIGHRFRRRLQSFINKD